VPVRRLFIALFLRPALAGDIFFGKQIQRIPIKRESGELVPKTVRGKRCGINPASERAPEASGALLGSG
jgi:hypothetical protein